MVTKPANRNLWLFFLLVLIVSSCARNPVTGRRQFVTMSERQEIELGRQYDPQIVATFGEYENEALMNFIREKGNEMGRLSHRPELEYHFRILDSPVVNAFAAPGGYIYFTRGILAQFSSEAELIGVLGHEMGHITARHMVTRQATQQLSQLLLIGGMIASEEFRRYGEFAMAGMQLLFLRFSRDDERESDRLGVQYSSMMGYDASRMADFFQVLDRMNLGSEHGGIPTFLSTHPDPGDRYSDVHQDAKRWQDSLDRQEWIVNTESYFQMIEGMVYGEDPRQGYVHGDAFYHPELRFQFPIPRGWELENMPVQVRMGPEDRRALMVFNIVQQNNLEAAASASLQQLQLNVHQSQQTTVNGMPAIATISTQTSQQQTIRVLSYFIDDNGTYYAFHGVSLEGEFDKYAPTFEATMTSFNRLNDPARINVQPVRLHIIRARQNAPLVEVFRQHNVPQQQMEEFAFLNNMELNTQVQAGTLLKIAR